MPNSLDSIREIPAEKLLHYSNATVFLAAFVGYFLLAQISLLLVNPSTGGTTFWPGAGLSLALLLMIPSQQWLWVIVGIGAAEFLGNQIFGHPFKVNIFWTAANCIEPLVAATLIRRTGSATGALAPKGNMIRFIAYGALVGPFIGASIGSLGSSLITNTIFWDYVPKWVISDALGVLVVAPVLMTRIKLSNPFFWPREQAFFTVALLLTGFMILRNWDNVLDLILPYLFLPYMLWAALRFGLNGTALTILYISAAAALSVALGYTPALAEEQGVTIMQMRLIVTSATSLVVAVLTHDLVQGLNNERRLLYQAQRDHLTGLYNRAGLNFRVESTIHRRATDKPVYLLICDLDGFKPINDRYGHQAGDEVLIEVANRLRSNIRDGDAVARVGGDEFVVLINNSDHASVNIVAKRILEQMALPINGSFGVVEISMSIGITSWEVDSNIDNAMHAADQALYKAKEEGKNRCVWSADLA